MFRQFSRRRFLMGAAAVGTSVVLPKRAFTAMSKKPLPPYDLSFLAPLSYFPRSEWTSDTPKPWILRPSDVFDRLTVHHSGTYNESVGKKEVASCIASIALDHAERKYGDLAYHFVIDAGGGIWEGRSLAYEGAHVAGQNENNLGVVLLGNFEEQTVPKAQLSSAFDLIEVLRSFFCIKQHRVYGHCDLGNTLCPGKNLYSALEKARNLSSDSSNPICSEDAEKEL